MFLIILLMTTVGLSTFHSFGPGKRVSQSSEDYRMNSTLHTLPSFSQHPDIQLPADTAKVWCPFVGVLTEGTQSIHPGTPTTPLFHFSKNTTPGAWRGAVEA